MRNKFFFQLAFAILLPFLSFSQTIPVQITQDTLKACQVNTMTADFVGTNADQYLTISGELVFGQNSFQSCGNSNGVLVEVLSLKNNHGDSVSYSL